MQYLTLIYAPEGTCDVSPDVLMQQYGDFTKAVVAAGVFKAGDALQPVATATSVRLRGGESRVTDGPFAETREQLGGYHLLECDGLDAALDWAAKIPSARFGTIEVRPVVVHGG